MLNGYDRIHILPKTYHNPLPVGNHQTNSQNLTDCEEQNLTSFTPDTYKLCGTQGTRC